MSQDPNLSAGQQQTSSPQGAPNLKESFFNFTNAVATLGSAALEVGKARVNKTVGDFRVEAQAAFNTAKEETQALYRDVKNDVHSAFLGALDGIAVAPEDRKTAVGEIVRALPGIGPTTRYADAWKLWHTAKLKNDESGLEKARADCLLAIGDAGIDITLLGSKLFCSVAKATRHILSPLIGARTARALGTEGDLFTSLAQTISKTEPAKSIVTYLLDSVVPTAKTEDLQRQAPNLEKELDKIVDQCSEEESKSTNGDSTPEETQH